MLRLLFIIVVAFLLAKITTFGWRTSVKTLPVLPEDSSLPERLKAHVLKLADEIGERSIFKYENLNQSADYITQQLDGLGLEIEFQEYKLYDKTARNIIARKTGREKPDEVIIVGAHYDTCFNPGANDNASGIAVLLELAGRLGVQALRRSVKFIAFTNEEPPFFKTRDMGSYRYARRAKDEGENIRLALILESVGYYSDRSFSQRYPVLVGPFFPHRANFIAVVGNLRNREQVRECAELLRKNSALPVYSATLPDFVGGIDFSDHWSFWQMGFPAVMISDTAFYRSRHYHRNSDTFEKLDYARMALLVDGLEKAIIELGGRACSIGTR